MSFKIYVPENYEVVETDEVVASAESMVYTHFFGAAARQHARWLNDQRIVPLFRYVAEPASPEFRKAVGWRHRWVCVPYQNVLRKKQ